MSKSAVVHLVLASLLVLSFAHQAAPTQAQQKTAYGILIDNTGSMRSQFKVVISLSKGIVEQIYQKGPVSLFPFKTQLDGIDRIAAVSSDLEWTQDKGILDRYIDSIFVVPGQTTLKDGVSTVAEHLNTMVSLDKDAFAGNAIFLITDGEDRFSKIGEKELLKALKDRAIKVYAIGLVGELDSKNGLIRKSPRERAVAFLERLTKETGGRAVFPKSKKVDVGLLLNELFTK